MSNTATVVLTIDTTDLSRWGSLEWYVKAVLLSHEHVLNYEIVEPIGE